MKRYNGRLFSAACAAVVLFGGAALAQQANAGAASHRPAARHQRVTPQQKQVSDQAMQTGLTALQAGQGALQSGNASQAASDIQSAISAMQSALPIYHGYRDRSIHAAGVATKFMSSRGKKAPARAGAALGRAIQFAQTAIQRN